MELCSAMPKPSTPTWPIASMMALSCAKVPPEPPYSSGMEAQSKPAAPAFFQLSRSKISAFSNSS